MTASVLMYGQALVMVTVTVSGTVSVTVSVTVTAMVLELVSARECEPALGLVLAMDSDLASVTGTGLVLCSVSEPE